MTAAADAGEEPIRAVDLFCGAGGLSWGLVEALKEVAVEADRPTEEFLAEKIDLVGVNHWETAIETHERNHPWARHFHDDVADVDPEDVFPEDDPDVRVVSGGIECTHWSTARGGVPVNDQKRMPAWDFIEWVDQLEPDCVLVENVPEFEDWGEVDEDGTPSRDGEVFAEWVDELHDAGPGYSVEWTVLNAADYGDATSRERLFILATREGRPEFPEPTHAEDPDPDDDRESWRTAADIIDWEDTGDSIWDRSRPLVNNTMQRIAEGIRRHGDDRLEPFADVVADLDKEDVERMQERAVPAKYAPLVAEVLDEPFLVASPGLDGEDECEDVPPVAGGPALADPHLVKYYGTNTARPVEEPIGTITAGGNKYGLCTPYLLGQHSNSIPRAVGERPVPTITTTGKVQLIETDPFVLGQHGGAMPRSTATPIPTVTGRGYIRLFDSAAYVLPRNGYHRGLHSNPAYNPSDRPLHTVTAKNHDGWAVRPTLFRYSHGGATLELTAPLGTITTARGGVHGIARPYLVPFFSEGPNQRPRTHSIADPLPTVTATGSDPAVTRPLFRPFLDEYYGNGKPQDVDAPMPTIPTKDRFALVIPDLYPWGLDIRFRMLQPRELAAAQGFPEDYEFAGTKTDTVEQIGNAVPVNLAQSLVETLVLSDAPTLLDFGDDGEAGEVETPSTATTRGPSGAAAGGDD